MKYTEILEQLINEINMSPSSLRTLAANIDARAGMEFEMIVPNVASEDDYWEPEPDFDQDESARSFDRIKDFFYDGDHNSRRDVDRLYDNLLENYLDSDFLSEKKQEAWGEASYDAVKDLVERDYGDDLRDQATDEVSANTPEFGVNGDEFSDAVDDAFRKLFDEKVDEILADMGSEYDEAYEEWEQNEWQETWNDYDLQEEWLEHEGLETMKDVADNYDINWPYWTEPDNQGEADIEQVAHEFGSSIGRKVNWSSNYHGGRREANTYVVEPDGSLDPDDTADSGLEFVSPPLPISELLSDLRAVKAWADEKGCYTNDSTGLHINVSVPGFSNEKLDYVKLAVLLGDDYVLNEFGRQGNTYCKSALGIVKSHIKQRPEDAAALLNKMKEHLNTAAAKVIHSGSTSKYTSINSKSGYIEFRSPGGDWLNENFDKIENTLLRFVVALDAAIDETKYKEEYAKKLYKLLAPSNDGADTLQYFARFSAGELPKSALASFVRQAQLQRKITKDPTSGQKYWWEVSRPGYMASIQVVAKNREEAIGKAIEPGNYPDWASARNTLQAKPIKPYDDSPVRATVGEPQPAGAVGRAQTSPTGQWKIVDGLGREIFRFRPASINNNRAKANEIAAIWTRENNFDGNYQVEPVEEELQPAGRSNINTPSQTDYENRLGWPDQTGDANYEIVERRTGRRMMVFIANTEQDAQRKYGQWLDQAGLPHETEDYGFRALAR